MIRLNITAEGFTEERFVTDILRNHLLSYNVYVEVRKVLTNRKLKKRGGIVSYDKFKNDVTQWFKECPDVYHTTLIDLYGLKNDFPGHKTTVHLQPYNRIAEMEKLMQEDLAFHKFIPYIQLHEFEALLFSNPIVMEEWLSLYSRFRPDSFANIRNSAPERNPELINESPETAPSKRILSICNDYDKVNDGILLLQRIGLITIRQECKHFNEWLTKLESLDVLK